jgi:hypothetical protein
MIDLGQGLHEHRIPAYVEQTGGGCATIYTGKPYHARDGQFQGKPCFRAVYPVVAGPGGFDWGGDRHTAYFGEFCIGPDDQGEGECYSSSTEKDTVRSLLDEMARQYKACEWAPLSDERIGKAATAGRGLRQDRFLADPPDRLWYMAATLLILTVEEVQEVTYLLTKEHYAGEWEID